MYWPDYEYRNAMTTYMNMLGELGLSRKIDLCWIKKIIVYFISYKFLSLLMRITGLNWSKNSEKKCEQLINI